MSMSHADNLYDLNADKCFDLEERYQDKCFEEHMLDVFHVEVDKQWELLQETIKTLEQYENIEELQSLVTRLKGE